MAGKSNAYAVVDLSGRNLSTSAKLVITIAGVELPISMFSMNYALNSIPTATAAIALGRNARTGKPSPVYDVIDEIKQMQPIVVKLKGSLGDWSPISPGDARTEKQQFPSGEFILFSGYVSGLSYKRSDGTVALMLSMVNNLIDLALSSTGSVDVVPGAPHDLMLPLFLEAAGAKLAASSASKFVSELPIKFAVDVSKGILDTLYSVASDNLLQVGSAWCDGGNPGGEANNKRANTRATLALKGFGAEWLGFLNFNDLNQFPSFLSEYPVLFSDPVRQKISKSISDRLAASFAGTSMWHALIGSIIPELGLSVVPLNNSAILVPAFEIARDAGITIEANDIIDLNFSTRSQRPLFGVGIMANQFMGAFPLKDKQCVGGTYRASLDPVDPVNDGMWLFVPAPDWLDDWDSFDDQAVNADGNLNRIVNLPSNTAIGEEKVAVKADPGQAVAMWNSVADKYAQMLYAANTLQGREGTLVSKLRFDVAPGSTIKIKSDTGFLGQGTDTLASDMYGFVNRVTVTINAQNATATTTFNLANMRTEAENKSDRFSMVSHPFYRSNYFNYAPLVEGLTIKGA
jgi:hypothetical protein